MGYAIGEFSSLTGISVHTLRYYEKENLIVPNRQANNRRYYSDKDIEWIKFIKRLKDTGMSIKKIQKYAQLRAVGDGTLKERMEMLMRHQTALREEITTMQEHRVNLDNKIGYYQLAIDKNR